MAPIKTIFAKNRFKGNRAESRPIRADRIRDPRLEAMSHLIGAEFSPGHDYTPKLHNPHEGLNQANECQLLTFDHGRVSSEVTEELLDGPSYADFWPTAPLSEFDIMELPAGRLRCTN